MIHQPEIKTVEIYSGISHLETFEKYYKNEIAPKFLSTNGVKGVRLNQLQHAAEQQPAELRDIQLIAETFYESFDHVRSLFASSRGKQLSQLLADNKHGKLASYLGTEKTFYSKGYMNGSIKDIAGIKTVGIYNRVTNLAKFEEYYTSEITPRFLQTDGVIKMRVTMLQSAGVQRSDDIQLIIQTFYDSPSTLKRLVSSPIGQEISQLIANNQNGQLGAFIGVEQVLLPRKCIS
ncbi:hypothetical protein [Hazenella coriacea]|uniref:Uncharacterized protein n=1 Tax=Hazenella coriacea TaxID=1179467 RepID=A0A4R3L3T0_9BACL|nr:hypothetical protein [Hazenella coriacea]TCS93588.1 hypothetical protein EDD58_10621 [Hazenella coriacea]